MTKPKPAEKPDKLDKILEKANITEAELKTLIKSSHRVPGKAPTIIRNARNHLRFGYVSDTHIGHSAFLQDEFELLTKRFNKEKLEFVLHPGDHLEGMSGRPGHIYELDQVGFTAQIQLAADLYSQLKMPIFGIDGNHDQWFFKKNNGGMVVGDSLESRVKNYTNLGQDEADLVLRPNLKIKLYHAGDGTAYAISYKLQKLIESFSGGQKPNLVLSGHYHKSMYMFSRNVHGFECGTLCGQTPWMRGKKIPAHTGYGIVDLFHDKNGIQRLKHEFFPIYEKERAVHLVK